uniref:Plant disease resistance polyprotein-like n=1 Tax=Oryza sativa subsp. japonica TaxID=39947 RepID=Q6ZGS2_ORYSJ|nr:plant disease resistance polyprotein-like [Oryza sativa Japonica Group]
MAEGGGRGRTHRSARGCEFRRRIPTGKGRTRWSLASRTRRRRRRGAAATLAAASGDRSNGSGGGGWFHGAGAMGSTREFGEIGKKREGATGSLNRGGESRTWPVGARFRRPTRGVGEEREAGFENRIPAISGAGADEREGEVGAGGAAHARAWPTWPGGGGGVGATAVAGAAARARGRRRARQVGPTCRRPGWEEGGGRPSWALAFGRPSGGEGRKENGPAAHPKRKGEKEKEKGRKGFSLELKYCLLNFNWLNLFLGL